MKWKDKLINQLFLEINKENPPSKKGLNPDKIIDIGIHLAVFNEPFLSLVLNGEKKIETRFSIHKISPFMKVKKGDIVILKKSGGSVIGAFIAGDVKFFNNLNSTVAMEIENKYGKLICSNYDKNFWKNRQKARYASLIEIKSIKKFEPFKIEKNDRTSWVTINDGITNTFFSLEK